MEVAGPQEGRFAAVRCGSRGELGVGHVDERRLGRRGEGPDVGDVVEFQGHDPGCGRVEEFAEEAPSEDVEGECATGGQRAGDGREGRGDLFLRQVVQSSGGADDGVERAGLGGDVRQRRVDQGGFLSQPPPGPLQHRRGPVESGDGIAAPRQLAQHQAGPAADLQNRAYGTLLGLPEGLQEVGDPVARALLLTRDGPFGQPVVGICEVGVGVGGCGRFRTHVACLSVFSAVRQTGGPDERIGLPQCGFEHSAPREDQRGEGQRTMIEAQRRGNAEDVRRSDEERKFREKVPHPLFNFPCGRLLLRSPRQQHRPARVLAGRSQISVHGQRLLAPSACGQVLRSVHQLGHEVKSVARTRATE